MMRQSPAPRACSKPGSQASLPQRVYHVLAEGHCPYLPGRRERKVITELAGPDAGQRYDLLSRAGFRRSHNFAYRPACSGCAACVPVRVATGDFTMSRSLKRVASMNRNLSVEEQPASATPEQFALFDRYIGSRHGEGDMAGMTPADYRAMVEHSHVETRVAEFRDETGRLVAACLIDWLRDGPSAVYSFFDPELERLSLGTFMVLWLIEAARAVQAPYVYLGYWIREAPKMAYKTRFQPLEGLGPTGWRVIVDI